MTCPRRRAAAWRLRARFSALLFAWSANTQRHARGRDWVPKSRWSSRRAAMSGGWTSPRCTGRSARRSTVTGDRLPPNQEFQLVWRTVKGSWKVAEPSITAAKYKPVAYEIAKVRSDAAGRFSASFTAPEDFGFSHDIVLQQGDRLLTQVAFSIDMTVTIRRRAARSARRSRSRSRASAGGSSSHGCCSTTTTSPAGSRR